MKIWAHRGCSQRYPENTLTAFEKAAELYRSQETVAAGAGKTAGNGTAGSGTAGNTADRNRFCGIELDVQFTKDGEVAVIHDERIDRTTDGYGFVRDYSLEELKQFHIYTGTDKAEHIPAFSEVLDLLSDKLRQGMKLNIELKNGIYPYPMLEEKTIRVVEERGLLDSVVWSSFSAKSLEKVRRLLPKAEIGILDRNASDCLYKLKGGCGANALHPSGTAVDLSKEELEGYMVRAWFGGHLFPEKPTGGRMDLEDLENKGVTDVFLNEPEAYV